MQERRRIVHPKGSVYASPKAKTQQHLLKECDINSIVAKARRGIAPTNLREPGSFLDVSDSPESLQEAYLRVQRAEDSFSALPAAARSELDNDPRRLLRVGAEFFERHGLLMPKPLEADPEPAKGAGKTPKGSAPTQPGKAPPKPKEAPQNEED